MINSVKIYRVEFLPMALRELDEISNYYIQKIGKQSAKNILDKIMTTIERLEIFPLSAPLIRDEKLSLEGYRILTIKGEYVCIYRLLEEKIYIYHIANGRREYKNLIND